MDDEMKAYVNSALDLDPTVKQMSFRQKRSIKSIFNDVKKKITTHQASDNSVNPPAAPNQPLRGCRYSSNTGGMAHPTSVPLG